MCGINSQCFVRNSLCSLSVTACFTGLLILSGCGRNPEQTDKDGSSTGPGTREDYSKLVPKVRFTDVTAKAGIHFTHVNGAFGKKLLPETMGGGVAVFDFDNDGKPDILFINSCYWPGFEKDGKAPTLALYRNKGNFEFEDVTEQAGLAVTMYGMGVTVGDYDNDGWTDIFITGVGGNRLFHNEPDGKGGRKFVEVTAQAGDLNEGQSWSTAKGDDFLKVSTPISFPSSAAWFDYDNDGKLDLIVCNYVTWSPKFDLDQNFTLQGKAPAYGPPRFFKGMFCSLYHNEGNGKFKNVTGTAGLQILSPIGEPMAKALGVVVNDIDEDGWPDIVIANDTVRNFFFRNNRDGTFKEIAQEAGVAYAEGAARGAMGIAFGEYRPGKRALVIGNFANEPNTLLRLDHKEKLLFSDVALIEGLAGPSRIVLKFGLFFFDFDLDGLLDLLTCNGHLEPHINVVQPGQSYKQPVQLFWNMGKKRTYEPVGPEHAGPDLFRPMVGRGCAFADFNGDGFLDVVLVENGGEARLLKNEGGTGHHWVRVLLEGDGVRTNKSAIGARVILTAGGKTQSREVTSAVGYLSQSEFAVTFGLGESTKVDKIEVIWPGINAGRSVLEKLEVDRLYQIKQAKN
ncbi:MAG: CRTAC1 family protein [Planctomycetes bacterium]|nr:CRTAC1 family protein [Planctomycetota bacterium]